MDDKLKATIEKIVLLARQNPEFNQELRKALSVEALLSHMSTSDKRIEHIEKYLGLDYYVDNQKSLIDYSFIQNLEVREQLISDNREMMRFRFGTRYHAICFDEFCRYAHLQAEMLLNYFYNKGGNNNIQDVINHIKKYNTSSNFSDSIKSLGNIPFSSKLWAFKAEFNLNYNVYAILDYLRRIRNESSHRSPETEEKSIVKYRNQLIILGLPLKSDGEVDYYKLENEKKNLYNNTIKNTDWYKDYKYLIWVHEESYDKVISAIEVLKNVVKSNIT